MVDEFYMRLALKAAWRYQGLTYPNPAVGCAVLDKNGKLLSVEAHKRQGEAHAELQAVSSALKSLHNFEFPTEPTKLHQFIFENHNDLLRGATIYVTLEPCNHFGSTPPCSLLLKTLHVAKVIVGTKDTNQEASGGILSLKEAGIEVKVGVLEDECKKLLEPFNLWRSGHFGFLKVAMSLNGVISGGVISSEGSRRMVHQIRDRLSMMAIGGNTVRVDRPTLDSRLCDGKAPDILIYSKVDNFERDIPLFDVPNRVVHVEDNLQKAFNSPFVMFEGGEGMAKALSEKVEWLLIFRSPTCRVGKTIQIEQNYERLCSYKLDDDLVEWYKKRG